MPTELEELVEFLHHGNTQIRQIAAENLVGYSTTQPSLFKRNQLEPVKDLKLLVKDYPPIAKNAITMLVNLSEDNEVLECLWEGDEWVQSFLRKLTDEKESNADLMCMLLANMAKSRRITDLVTLQYETATNPPTSARALVQLIDCFAKGAGGNYNKTAEYDYLAYVFADLAMQLGVRVVFITPYKATGGESVMPLSQLIVFTEQHSTIRRRGVAGTIKNMCFDISSHGALLAPMDQGGVGLLPYILLPLMGNEDYSDEDTEGMLDECQLLPPDKQREPETDIICTHLESLLLLTTMRAGREKLRDVKVYPIIRELHQHVEDQDVGHGCDRIVQVLMRDEEGEAAPKVAEIAASNYDGQVEEEDEDERVIEVL